MHYHYMCYAVTFGYPPAIFRIRQTPGFTCVCCNMPIHPGDQFTWTRDGK